MRFYVVFCVFYCDFLLWYRCEIAAGVLGKCRGIAVGLLRYCCGITAVPMDLLVLLWDSCAIVTVLLLDYCVVVLLSYCRGRDLDAARSAAREI